MRGEESGLYFQTTGTAVSTSATATKIGVTNTLTYITDLSASSDVGTATVQLRDDTAAIWQQTITTTPLVIQFKSPMIVDGTATLVIAGASNSLKTVNFQGYII